jgi:hypothetical protein
MFLSGGTDHPTDLSADDSGHCNGVCPTYELVRLPGRGAGVGRGEDGVGGGVR